MARGPSIERQQEQKEVLIEGRRRMGLRGVAIKGQLPGTGWAIPRTREKFGEHEEHSLLMKRSIEKRSARFYVFLAYNAGLISNNFVNDVVSTSGAVSEG